ncbi:MAG: mannose-1-phosphate guanylyltransferase/mannose-6-phosphate isomerase [Methylobacteriaceae bacterium]|jgi:mannose-1-phosphate guanylyltransferase|nr:mannose-1-phosphate guanylyltransferase/mannose-6-phosphate isomerase [Methylobacteriaceae bacterium]
MSGGTGARLWPVSRETYPKPFFRLADGLSLLQHAFLRASKLASGGTVLTITNAELYFGTEEDYAEVNSEGLARHYLLEPEGRDTAAATAAVSLYVQKVFGDDAVVILFPADHLMNDLEAFVRCAREAVHHAGQGRLVTFGVEPTRPETGYGYIEADSGRVLRFVEKPDEATAREYLRYGNFYWNAGIFCFAAKTMVNLQQRLCPDILDCVRQALENGEKTAIGGAVQTRLDPNRFRSTRKTSVDYAVLEKADNLAVVTCAAGWSDIGSWNAISELTPADDAGNRTTGAALMLESRNCYIHNDTRLVATIGVEDLLIIDSDDALLVAARKDAQKVKQAFDQLKTAENPVYYRHRTIYRPWGNYTVLEEGEGFKIKRTVVKPGAFVGEHRHQHRSEHWVVLRGTADIRKSGQESQLFAGQSTFIAAGETHRLGNAGQEPLIVIEVQSGAYLSEDDVVHDD